MGQSQSVVFPPRWPTPQHMQGRFIASRSGWKGALRQAPLQEISFSQISRLWLNRKLRHYVTDCICHIAQAKAGGAEDLGLASKIPALGRIGRWRIVRLWLCAMGALAAHAGVFCLAHAPYYESAKCKARLHAWMAIWRWAFRLWQSMDCRSLHLSGGNANLAWLYRSVGAGAVSCGLPSFGDMWGVLDRSHHNEQLP